MTRQARRTTRLTIVAVVCIGATVLALKYRDHPKQAHAKAPKAQLQDVPVSFVLLLREPRALNNEMVRAAAKRAWGVDLSSQDPNSTDFIVGDTMIFTLETGGHHFSVTMNEGPYEALRAEDQSDARLAAVIQAHKAWLAVDVQLENDKLPEKAAHQFIGKLAAELAGPDCLAIYATKLGAIGLLTPQTLAILRSDDPRAAVGHDEAAVVLAPNDPAMKASTAEAQKRLPEFLTAFGKRSPDDNSFNIYAQFVDGNEAECLSINVTAIQDGVVDGTIEEQPTAIHNVKIGDTVRVKVADIMDWNFEQGQGELSRVVGDFRDAALKPREQK